MDETEELDCIKAARKMLPNHMIGSIERYIMDGIPPGSFLFWILANNLKMAVGAADSMNINYIPHYAQWIMWHCPADAQGSEEKVNQWCADGGLNGIR